MKTMIFVGTVKELRKYLNQWRFIENDKNTGKTLSKQGYLQIDLPISPGHFKIITKVQFIMTILYASEGQFSVFNNFLVLYQ